MLDVMFLTCCTAQFSTELRILLVSIYLIDIYLFDVYLFMFNMQTVQVQKATEMSLDEQDRCRDQYADGLMPDQSGFDPDSVLEDAMF